MAVPVSPSLRERDAAPEGSALAAIHKSLASLVSEYEARITDLQGKNYKMQQRLDAMEKLGLPGAFSIPGAPCQEVPIACDVNARSSPEQDPSKATPSIDNAEGDEVLRITAMSEASSRPPSSASVKVQEKQGKKVSAHIAAMQRAASGVRDSGEASADSAGGEKAKAFTPDVEQDLLHLRQIIDNDDNKRRLASQYEQRLKEAEVGANDNMGVRGLLTLRRRVSYAPEPEEEMKLGVWRRRAIKLIGWWMFDAIIGCVIIGNAITIGVETSHVVAGQDVPIAVQFLEALFLATYIIELFLRVFAVGLPVFGSHWVKFDAFLVFCGILDSAIKIAYAGQSAAVLDKIMLIRMLRLVRLVRAARLVVQFRTLWLLVQGLYLSCLPMFWVFLIMAALIYIFGVLGLELIRTDEFSNLGDAMLTLTQLIFLDGGSHIYVKLMQEKPWLGMYFFAFVLLGSVSLMNLITAIMVESSLRQAKDDQEAQKAWELVKRKQMEPVLMEIFHALDADNSKELEIDEIMGAPQAIKEQLLRICNMDDLEEVFEMLDYDDSGAVDIQEFCDGIMRVQADKPAELVRLVKQCSDILKHCKWMYAAMKSDSNMKSLYSSEARTCPEDTARDLWGLKHQSQPNDSS